MTATLARIPALTIRRPWAQLIAAGRKHVENRGWATSYRGLLLIHAGKAWERSGEILANAEGLRVVRADCAAGYIATARLVNVHEATETCLEGRCAPWGMPDQHHWVLADAKPFDEPIEGGGLQGLFTKVPEAVRQLLAYRAERGEL